MIINEANGNIINTKEVCMHDDVLVQVTFDSSSKNISMVIAKCGTSKDTYTVNFMNACGFEMTACDFWGKSECILDFEYIEEEKRLVTPKLKNIWEEESSFSFDFIGFKPIETRVTLSSGDTLVIVCEYIVFNR